MRDPVIPYSDYFPACTTIVGIDPGVRSPAVIQVYRAGLGERLCWDRTYRTTQAWTVVCEAQHVASKSSKQSLITLAFSAGVLAGYYSAYSRRIYVATARTWRGVFGRGVGGKSKDAALNVIWRDFANLLPARPESDDEADAIAITLAYILKPEVFTRYVQKGLP